jgi:hypothetical protein
MRAVRGTSGRPRHAVARGVVSGSAGGLTVGKRNEQFYAQYRSTTDDLRAALGGQRTVRGLPCGLPCRPAGTVSTRPRQTGGHVLRATKRPLDLAAAVTRLSEPVTTLFVSDGELAGAVRAALPPVTGAVTGFVKQRDCRLLPRGGQSEPGGLVVNEAMTVGVLPVVSDRVGCGRTWCAASVRSIPAATSSRSRLRRAVRCPGSAT